MIEAGQRWYCARTKPNVESRVVLLLRELGFANVWLPLILRERGWPRPSARHVPWIPCYLFVSFDVGDEAWKIIPSRPGVVRLFSSDPEKPTALPEGAVEQLMEHPDLQGPPRDPTRLLPVPVGAVTRVMAGPLRGFEGLCAWSDEKKVAFLHGLLGGRLTVPRELVTVVR